MADDEWGSCPECGKKVKSKNLGRHLQKVHDLNEGDARSTLESMMKREEKTSKKARKRQKAYAVLIVLFMLVMGSSLAVTLFTGDTTDDDNDGGIEPVDDPNRVEFTTDDGFLLVGSYFKARDGVINRSTVDRPTLILVHGMNERRSVWTGYGFVDDALDMGFNVLTFDIRMHGESVYKNGKKVELNSDDLKFMDLDVRAAVSFVNTRYATNGQFAVAGASIGANAALKAAVYEPAIRSIVLLSPGLNYQSQGIPSYDPIFDTGPRPVFIACSQLENARDECETLADRALNDPFQNRNVRLEIYPGVDYHGTNLFKIALFNSDLQDWLVSTMIA